MLRLATSASTKIRRAALGATLSAMCFACGCDVFAPQVIQLPGDSVKLVIENRSNMWVNVSSTFSNQGKVIRQTTRRLAPNGSEETAELIPTQAETLEIDATEALSPFDQRPAQKLVRRELRVLVDFQPGNTVTVVIGPNPSAVVVAPAVVTSGDLVRLDARGSSNGGEGAGALAFLWTQDGGPSVEFQDAAAARVEFTAPLIPIGGKPVSLSFAVLLTNGFGQSIATGLTLRVDPPEPIRALYPNSRELRLNESAELQIALRGGVAPFSVSWTPLDRFRFPGILSDSSSANPTWTPPEGRVGAWSYRINIQDAQGNQSSAIRRVIVRADGDQIQDFVDCFFTGGAAPCPTAPYADMDEDELVSPDDLNRFIAHLLRIDGLGN